MLHELAAKRWKIALLLTFIQMVAYFGFILLIAFNKSLMAREVVSGLSVGMLTGASVIIISWVLTGVYAWWANNHFDHHIHRIKNTP